MGDFHGGSPASAANVIEQSGTYCDARGIWSIFCGLIHNLSTLSKGARGHNHHKRAFALFQQKMHACSHSQEEPEPEATCTGRLKRVTRGAYSCVYGACLFCHDPRLHGHIPPTSQNKLAGCRHYIYDSACPISWHDLAAHACRWAASGEVAGRSPLAAQTRVAEVRYRYPHDHIHRAEFGRIPTSLHWQRWPLYWRKTRATGLPYLFFSCDFSLRVG